MNKYKAKAALKILYLVGELKEITTITSNFLKAFKKYSYKKGDHYYLHGKYRIPSTISGRPTSSDPNLLNIPSSGTVFAKPIKKCFVAPKGRLLVGADYSSQEHMANALITKDPNMLLEYSQGIDGHSMRAYNYFKKDFPKEFIAKVDYVQKHGSNKKYFKDSKGNIYTEEELND